MTEVGGMAPFGLGARAVSNALFILGARIVSRVISLVVVLVLANSLGDTNYGRYSTLIAFSALVSVVADLGFNPLYTREAARSPQELVTTSAPSWCSKSCSPQQRSASWPWLFTSGPGWGP